ncbi:MAG: D-glycero-beta-D-manno-heptose 1-phosphate adenylyltransferase [Chlorobiota bacterium]|nr:D-glycero-beta-D-manno-heptose 1-phosphate adenylyltransferase [Chlorobiota bacterium]QQS67096.1 MAG: D-glycero-beta-D-manno-heptose 1-phosphate adenylyltransferase [Chlorobiota bacterium]
MLTNYNRIFTLEKLVSVCEDLHKKNKKIVFTNGCFDLLHIGHVRYLEEASKLGDVVIVGINSDLSVKKLKGKSRPVITEQERAEVISSLRCVDYTTIFNEETPLELIKLLKPNVLVKGGDYDPSAKFGEKYIVGSEFVKEVKVITFVDGKSSSKIIEQLINIK